MNSEKVKAIKKALEFQRDGLMYLENNCIEIVYCKDILALINELESKNELLRNAKVVYETVDYCAEDLWKAEKQIKELEKENKELLKENEGYRGSYRCAIDKIGELSAERYIKVEQFAEMLKQMPFNIEFTFKESSYEDIKKLANLMKEYLVKYIDETLKEFIVI